MSVGKMHARLFSSDRIDLGVHSPRTYTIHSNPRRRQFVTQLHRERLDEAFASTIGCQEMAWTLARRGGRRDHDYAASSACRSDRRLRQQLSHRQLSEEEGTSLLSPVSRELREIFGGWTNVHFRYPFDVSPLYQERQQSWMW